MKKKQMETFRPQLQKMEQRFRGDVDTLEDEVFHTSDGMAVDDDSDRPVKDLAELASNNYCEETTIGLIENSSERLEEISAALKRIDNGTFGSCEKCGHEISKDRLQAVPFARQCIACAGKAERGEVASLGNV
jgi:RNA polymerase-binding protein DksA